MGRHPRELERGASPTDKELVHAVAGVSWYAIAIDPATEKAGYLARGREEANRHGEEVAVE